MTDSRSNLPLNVNQMQPWGPFQERCFHRNLNQTEIWNWCNSNVVYHDATKFCTAVVPCAKFQGDNINIHVTWMTAE